MDETVNAGDIARLAEVGRAAVSNWRRRFDDFPAPVGGTASSPLYLLRDVEAWLRGNGKSFRVSPAERLWTQLRTVDDLKLGEALAEVEADAKTFEFLHERYLRTHSRLLNPTPPDIARLMVSLTEAHDGTVTDPACGTGLVAEAGRGQAEKSARSSTRCWWRSPAPAAVRAHRRRRLVAAQRNRREGGRRGVRSAVARPDLGTRGAGRGPAVDARPASARRARAGLGCSTVWRWPSPAPRWRS